MCHKNVTRSLALSLTAAAVEHAADAPAHGRVVSTLLAPAKQGGSAACRGACPADDTLADDTRADDTRADDNSTRADDNSTRADDTQADNNSTRGAADHNRVALVVVYELSHSDLPTSFANVHRRYCSMQAQSSNLTVSKTAVALQ